MISDIGTAITNLILGIGLGIVIFMFVAYLIYMIGLAVIFRRLHVPAWKAFIPFLNFYALIKAMGAPSYWFFAALLPYVGFVYSVAVALRLGNIFGRGVIFSATWLTLGAPVGVWVVVRDGKEPNLEILNEPPQLVSRKQHKANLAAAKAARAAKA